MIALWVALAFAEDAPPVPAPELCPDGSEPFEGLCVGATVDVEASQLGDPKKSFEHAGARTVVDAQAIQQSGATGVGEALRGVTGVKVVEATGTGNTDTKLNVSVRGLDPRLSARSTVLLDEVPLAVAPYGQPQMSLFPLSMFSIDSIDVVRSGSSVRYGPQNVGGVINLRTKPIPETLTAAVLAQSDRWGDTSFGVQAGGSTGRVGALVEYAPRFGESYRRESAKEVHGGLLKLWANPVDGVEITSTTHAYYEESELPGGLSPDAYALDPRQSQRPLDGFSGRRLGTALNAKWQVSEDTQVQLIGYGQGSFRQFRMADLPEPASSTIFTLPRDYLTFGAEPRLTHRLRTGPLVHTLSTGYRRNFEDAHYESRLLDRYTGHEDLQQDDDAQLVADALYLDDEISLFDEALRFDVGVRLEDVRVARRDNLRLALMRQHYTALLPAASVWWSPSYEVAAFAGYARSFGSPQFLQVVLAGAEDQLTAEVADTFELGGRIRELGGFDAELTGFHMRFQDQIEFDDTTFENIGETWHTGVEASLYFWPGWYAEALDGLELEVGDTFLVTEVVAGPYAGKELPYAPRHSWWWEAGWTFGEEGPKVSVDGWWEAAQFSDSKNTVAESPTGAYGRIPAFMVWNVRASYDIDLAPRWGLDLRGGVKNVLDEDYWYRSEDRNEGILPSRGRTPYLSAALRWTEAPRK